jgi:hypothetical protein
MIINADAVIEPWTVMIEPLNALVADRTVPAARSSEDFAVGAQFPRVHLLEQFEEVVVGPHYAWVLG